MSRRTARSKETDEDEDADADSPPFIFISANNQSMKKIIIFKFLAFISNRYFVLTNK